MDKRYATPHLDLEICYSSNVFKTPMCGGAHTCNSSSRGDRVKDNENFKVIFKLHCEFEASLGYTIPCFKKKGRLTGNRMWIPNAGGERDRDRGEINSEIIAPVAGYLL